MHLTHLCPKEFPVPTLAIILAPWTSQGGKQKSEEQTPTAWTRAAAAALSIRRTGRACHSLNPYPPLHHLENSLSHQKRNAVSEPVAHWEGNLSVKQNYTLLIACVCNTLFRNSRMFWVVYSERQGRRSKFSYKAHDAENISAKYKKTKKGRVQINF